MEIQACHCGAPVQTTFAPLLPGCLATLLCLHKQFPCLIHVVINPRHAIRPHWNVASL